MANDDATTRSALSEQPAPNPDAATTVSDFLDYTEFFPSDLLRSLRLISDLDGTYLDATQTVHDLTKTYGVLPGIPAAERPDPVTLRKEIAAALDKAIYARTSTFEEASRLYEVAERHCKRLHIIKRKLQALPQPPSRDPTPAPVSPQATRSKYDKTPRIHLHFDGGRHGESSTARPRDRSRKSAIPLHRRVHSPVHSASSSDMSDAESDLRSIIDLASPNRPKHSRDRQSKPPRNRTPGRVGTNVHSSIAGISTSNALARLSPPPADARPGSRFAPWFKLTEYEMAVLRKQMKKNAIWCPSDTMIRRELERKNRGYTFYAKEKKRCEEAGEEMLDEDPDKPPVQKAPSPAPPPIPPPPPPAAPPTDASAPAEATETENAEPSPAPAPAPMLVSVSESASVPAPVPAPVPPPVSIPVPILTPAPAPDPALAPVSVPISTRTPTPTPPEPPRDSPKEDTTTVNKDITLNAADEAKKSKRESQREQAMRDAQDLENATRKIKEAAENLKELTFSSDNVALTPITQGRRKSAVRPSNKRKREPSPAPTAETPIATTREPSLASQDSGTKPPDPKRIRLPALQPIAPAPTILPSIASAPPADSTPQTITSVVPSPVVLSPAMLSPMIPSPVANTHVPLPNESTKTTTVQVPLAPAGPSTPKTIVKLLPKVPSRHATPAAPSPTETRKSPPLPPPPQPTATAASSRPRRESVAPKVASPPTPPAPIQTVQPAKTRKTPTPAPEPAPDSPFPATRPRSARGHVPTPKAQSEEPKLNDLGNPSRELRRHSIFSQSAIAAPTRMSTRKKPPPKGDITSAEDGRKTVTNVKRAQGSKNKKKKNADGEHEASDDVDPNEPTYCICDDVSYGQMIMCDNNCEKEWFHLSCVNMKEGELPSRRAKWYCPDCRQQLGTDAYGNPAVPPPLPGRRGNRGWST